MRFIIVGFIVLLVSALIGIELSADPGHLLITINHWTIETTLTFAILAVIISFLLLHALIVLFKKFNSIPQNLKNWQHQRQLHRAQAMTRKGLIEFSEGYWSLAQKHLMQALPLADTPLINYLTAARAAQELGENQRRDDFLREAQQSMPDTKIAVELTQAQLQLAHQQWEQALATLRHLQAIAPKHPHVLKLLMLLYEEIKDWSQLIQLLPLLKKEAIISDTVYNSIRLNAYTNSMRDLIKTNQVGALTAFVQNLPKDLKLKSELIVIYAEFLIRNQQLTLAESLLRLSLKKHFQEDLIRLYGLVALDPHQLSFAESLIKKAPDSSVLFLSLGRLCFLNQLWGKAETYLEKSIALKPSRDAYAELGNYYLQCNNLEKACKAYKEALLIFP